MLSFINLRLLKVELLTARINKSKFNCNVYNSNTCESCCRLRYHSVGQPRSLLLSNLSHFHKWLSNVRSAYVIERLTDSNICFTSRSVSSVSKLKTQDVDQKPKKKKKKSVDKMIEMMNSSSMNLKKLTLNDAIGKASADTQLQGAIITVPATVHNDLVKYMKKQSAKCSKSKKDNRVASGAVVLEDVNIDGHRSGCHDTISASSVTDVMKEPLDILKSSDLDRLQSSRPDEVNSAMLKRKAATSASKKNEERKTQRKREEMINMSLRPYLSVCIRAGLIFSAHSVFDYFRRMSHRRQAFVFKDVTVYNILLEGWVFQRNYKRIIEVVKWLKADKIKPDEQTFVLILYCLSDQNKKWHYKLAQRTLRYMQQHGFRVEAIFNTAKFIRDQREQVLKTITTIRPDYVPDEPIAIPEYLCNLVKELNSKPPQNLSHDVLGGCLNKQELLDGFEKQFEIEKKGHVNIQSIVQEQSDNVSVKKMRNLLKKHEKMWTEALHNAFVKELKMSKRKSNMQRLLSIYPFLSVLPAQVYVDTMSQELQKLAEASESFSPTVSYLYKNLGLRIMNRYLTQDKEYTKTDVKLQKLLIDYCDYIHDPRMTAQDTQRVFVEKLKVKHSSGPSLDSEDKLWPYHILVAIGKFLYGILLNTMKIDVNIFKSENMDTTEKMIPAFYSIYRSNGKHVKEEVKAHPILVKLFRDAKDPSLIFDCHYLPMLSPPLPWMTARKGGYLLTTVPFIRLPEQAQQQWSLPGKVPPNQLDPVLDSLNQLSLCPWIVNKPILDIIINIYNGKGSKELSIPQHSSEFPPPPKYFKNMSSNDIFKLKKERMQLKRMKSEMYSLWCDALYKLSIANHFRDRVFWFPHNLDFRGRVYPCPPHFNHLGNDMTRSMLLFAKGRKLGEHGLNWLKVHLVNLTGLKKRSPVNERLEYANEILPDVIDSADFPLEGRKWWMKSDEPWQTLSACMEVARAERSPNPERYVCHLPVHQDGSCNGLQHYAALGRDQEGAEQVNLHPFDRPQDVYSGVAALVEEKRAQDATNGSKIAKVLEGFVSRKVIKQTVMTVVYGVTKFGGKLQIEKQLRDIPSFPKEYCHQGSSYLTSKTFESLGDMFSSTRKIQDWLTDSARLISQIRVSPIEWITPLGLPVRQPYHKQSSNIKVPGSTDSFSGKYSSAVDIHENPNTMKQKNAFPPNFVHSLDSTHMMLTSLFCQRAGITFASVHDCFWTHPDTVHIMNKICREQFVSLHKEPILQNLSDFLINKFGYSDGGMAVHMEILNMKLADVPKSGKFDLDGVLSSVYFFS